MSFMFKPFRYTDPEALNCPQIPAEIATKAVVTNEKIAEVLCQATPTHGVLLLDGYVGAQFVAPCKQIQEAAAGKTVKLIDVSKAYKNPAEMVAMLAESLPEDKVIDPILLFGKYIHREIESLFDSEKLVVLVQANLSIRWFQQLKLRRKKDRI